MRSFFILANQILCLSIFQVSDSPPGEEFEGSGVFEGSGLFGDPGEDPEGSGAEDGMGGDDEAEGPVYFFLEESTGYMQPTLSFLAILHTVIAFICIIGYNCLKVCMIDPHCESAQMSEAADMTALQGCENTSCVKLFG